MVRAKKRYKVLALFGSAGTPPADQDFSKELKTDDFAAEAHVIGALEQLGHEVRTLGIWDEVTPIIDEIKAHPFDVVFNLTEHFNEVSAYDRNVAGLLEMIGVPYTGSSPTGLTLCKNKGMAKELLAYHKILVPNFAVYSPGAPIKRPSRLKFPLFIKPAEDEASYGIALDSFVEDDNAFEERVRFIHERMNQPALAEEFIEGREIYVSLLGNDSLRVFPFREVIFTQVPTISRNFPRSKPNGMTPTANAGASKTSSPKRSPTAPTNASRKSARRSTTRCASAATAASICASRRREKSSFSKPIPIRISTATTSSLSRRARPASVSRAWCSASSSWR